MKFAAPLFAALTLAMAAPAFADDLVTYESTLTGTTFSPAEIKVPADKPFMMKFNNANAKPAEFEAKELRIEKVAAGNTSIIVRIKAQKPGKYLFVDEFQEDVAKGYVIVE